MWLNGIMHTSGPGFIPWHCIKKRKIPTQLLLLEHSTSKKGSEIYSFYSCSYYRKPNKELAFLQSNSLNHNYFQKYAYIFKDDRT